MTDEGADGSEPRHTRRRPGRRKLLAGGVVVLVVLAGAGIYWAVGGSGSAGATPAAQVTSVAVSRTDLIQTVSYDGTLAYSGTRDLQARSPGTVTAVPSAGATLTQGKTMYRIDEQPLVLMYGALPMYRTLRPGVADGADVRQLETALKALGYDPDGMTVDTVFTSATTDAINAWKAGLNITQDGAVTPAQLMFSPGPLRVDTVSVLLGQQVQSGGTIASLTSTDRAVTVSLKTTDAAVAKVGDAVTIQLATGTPTPGHITSIAAAAESTSSQSTASTGGATNSNTASSGTTTATVEVGIKLDNPKAVGTVSQSPVTVVFTQEKATGVLAVPVTALLALAGGGYAVQIDDGGGKTHLVAVRPGLFAAGGLVAVTGDGIAEGTRVVVPAS
ncbi:MAG: peptidoglycan-binding protein [Actinomycetota bacterium]|nr:peptidoglycan-binding protein [Actinomycetota bacterium]